MVKRKDLVDVGDKNYRERSGEKMMCNDCGEIIGGTRGDFFMLGMEDELRCWACDGELELGFYVTEWYPI